MFTRDSLPRVFYTALEYIEIQHTLSDVRECIRLSNKLIGIYVFRFILRTQNDK